MFPSLARNAAALASVGCALTFAGSSPATVNASPKVDHVLLLSLDGFHDFDLTNYVAAHPGSALAQVVARGRRYIERVRPRRRRTRFPARSR